MINLKINGKLEALAREMSISELLTSRGVDCNRVVVEYNDRIVPKGEWFSVYLGEGDILEIISFMGGG